MQRRVILIFSAYVVLALAANYNIQPPQNELVFSAANCDKYPTIDDTSKARLTGGCATLNFCCRGNSYDDGLFGYRDDSGRCSTPGPILRLKPGLDYGLIVCAEKGITEGTNVHTHGLHVSGSGNSDDITRYVEESGCMFYEYNVPSYHMGGTMWYHSHLHMQTRVQVSGGAMGLLIVKDQPMDKTLNPYVGNRWDRKEMYNFLTDSRRELILTAFYNIPAATWKNANQNDSSTYHMDKDEWYRMRVLTVNANSLPQVLTIPAGCIARAMSHDGIYRFTIPKAPSSTYYLTGASRLDIAIKCTEIGSHPITIGVDPSTNHDCEDGIASIKAHTTIATLEVSKCGNDQNRFHLEDKNQFKTTRPPYLIDLSHDQPDNHFEIDITRNSINNLPYNPHCPLKNNTQDFVAGRIEEWTMASAGQHPSHLHMYPMQVMGGCGPGHDVGEYYDVLADASASPVVGTCKGRFLSTTVHGRTIIHCHILGHEDNGAMGWINMVGRYPNSPVWPCCISGKCSECVAEDSLPNDCGEDGGHGGHVMSEILAVN